MHGRDAPSVFFHVVNARYEKRHPTLVTTNRGLPDWGQVFGGAVAAAILDRLMHDAVVINIKGPSWRLIDHHPSPPPPPTPTPATPPTQAPLAFTHPPEPDLPDVGFASMAPSSAEFR